MVRIFLIFFSILILCTGCTRTSRKGIISEALPLTVDDLATIRAGEQNHQDVLLEFDLYQAPKMQSYLNEIASNVASVSTRPNLPYKVYVLDNEDINIFGGPGGYIYISKGMLQFVRSESEIAGIIAHEIAHQANHEYDSIPAHSKMQKAYGLILRGSELAKDSIGTYGTAAHYGIQGLGKATPVLIRRFGRDQEVVADKAAIQYLLDAGYDPRDYKNYIDRLAQVPVADVNRFIILMNAHPPFYDRQVVLSEKMKEIQIEKYSIDFKTDMLGEMRQTMIERQEPAKKKNDSILFKPAANLHFN